MSSIILCGSRVASYMTDTHRLPPPDVGTHGKDWYAKDGEGRDDEKSGSSLLPGGEEIVAPPTWMVCPMIPHPPPVPVVAVVPAPPPGRAAVAGDRRPPSSDTKRPFFIVVVIVALASSRPSRSPERRRHLRRYAGSILVAQCTDRSSTTMRLHACRSCDVPPPPLAVDGLFWDAFDLSDDGIAPVVMIRDEYGDTSGDEYGEDEDEDEDGT